ncbi:MAG: glycerophosphodiester phosphodiesterase, partial [Planctomycetes bacterium]|nr:glycerophosphodiester phosphodiesterase [Planctomycetota bacterium]
FIELKAGPEIVPPMVRLIESSGLDSDQIVIISFDADAIAACERERPHLKTHWLAGYEQQKDGRWKPTVDEVIAAWKQTGADGFGTQSRPEHVNEKFIARLRDAGCREFHVWTVDDPRVARFYQELGAWSITTNRPGWLREELGMLSSP